MNAVVATNLTLAYGSTIALKQSSFSIPTGTVTAVIGPNGAGKSSVLNAIAGLMEPAEGTIEVPPISADRRRIAYVLQTTKINDALPISVREVVTMGRYAAAGPYRRLTPTDRTAVDEAMTRMGIADVRVVSPSEPERRAATKSLCCPRSGAGTRRSSPRRAADRH